jgi:putative oxidoreductase
MQLGLALLRTLVGGLFMGHGLQKLAGMFGGHGLEGTGESFEAMDLRPGKAHAAGAGASETAGGALLAAGLLTPLGASMISGTMLTAIRKVHGSKGPWLSNGGYEYNLVLLAAVFLLAEEGPGSLALDDAFGTRRAGAGWALAQLAAAAIGSSAVVALGARQPASDAGAATSPDADADSHSAPAGAEAGGESAPGANGESVADPTQQAAHS